MLTHTIRALSLLGLFALAHVARPFSLSNVATFAAQTIASVASVLPAETVESLQEFGSLAALVTGNHDLFAARLAPNTVTFKTELATTSVETGRAARPAAVASRSARPASRLSRRTQSAVALQARQRSQFGGAPLPFIPGLESSLMPSATWLALPPPVGQAQGEEELTRPALDVFGWPRKHDDSDEQAPEQSLWLLERHKPVEAVAPVKLLIRTPSPSRAQACPQPQLRPVIKGTAGLLNLGRQSC